ncbi:TPA: transposase [Yersinia enterocolitica]|nr:transposase [Yersinia enterocolitica]HEK7317279.1 transposase [Yersinia enterocolitica]HEN3294856.1 transposase [Yersinia enterocolitica]
MERSLFDENARLRALLDAQQQSLRQMAEYNRVLSQRVAAYASEINRLKALVVKLQRMQFGKSSEKLRQKTERQVCEAQERITHLQEEMAVRKARTLPLMQSLYDWIQAQMKVLSRHSDTAKAFAYLLKQWDALNLYCSNGWAEIDNNIAENALRGVALGRKNWLFAGSDEGGEHAAILYSLIDTCRLNGMDPEAWLRYVLGHIQDWPVNQLRDLLPWKTDLTSA